MLQLKIDRNAGHIEHLYVVSYDAELYYNPDAEPVVIDLEDPNNAKIELNEYYKNVVFEPEERVAVIDKSIYADYFRNLHSQSEDIFRALAEGDVAKADELFESYKVALNNMPVNGAESSKKNANNATKMLVSLIEEMRRLTSVDEESKAYLANEPSTTVSKYVSHFITNYRTSNHS